MKTANWNDLLKNSLTNTGHTSKLSYLNNLTLRESGGDSIKAGYSLTYTTMQTKKAKDLKPGDVIMSGVVTYVGPSEVEPNTRVRVDTQSPGKHTISHWNANTTLTVKS